jgi:hypothetical protein
MSYIEGVITRQYKHKNRIKVSKDYYEMLDARIINKNLV